MSTSFEVNRDRKTRCKIRWSNSTLKCDANTFVKLTHYLLSERVFLPKASVARNWVIKNLRQIQFAIQEEQLYTECGARLKNIYLSKLLCICLSLFQKISTKKDIASTEISYQFLAAKVSVLRWNIPTNSSTSTDPLGIIYSSFFDLPSHSQGSLPLGIMKRIRPLLNFLYLYPQVANFPCESDVRSKKLE